MSSQLDTAIDGDAGRREPAVRASQLDRALADFLMAREQDATLTAAQFALQLPVATRARFSAQARAILEVDDLLASPHGLPQTLGEYRLLELVGEGGTARVFAAEHIATGERVALKVLHRHLANQPRARARFCREARIAARVRHARCVSVRECRQDRGELFLVLPWVAGSSLQQLLHAAQRRQPDALTALADHRALAAQFAALADALQQAHRAGVVHRDLKPGNLMREPDGTLRVLDFGLGTSPDVQLTRSCDFLGTPTYMSPEQAAGANAQIGPASDIYSLGAVLYECVTLQPIVVPGSLPAVLDAVRHAKVPPAHARAEVDRALSRILSRCLDKRPHRRYADAAALAADLRAYAAGPTRHAASHACWRRAAWLVFATLTTLFVARGPRAATRDAPSAAPPPLAARPEADAD